LRWIHEIKFDGYRTQAHLRNGKPAIYTRRVYDWTWRFQTIADALATLPANDLILDGEAVVADSRGVPDFALLHADLAAGRQDRLVYCAFDLFYLDGFDLRGAPLLERKRLLVDLLADASERILYAEHLEGDGPEIHERAWHEPTQSRSRGASSQPLGSGTSAPDKRAGHIFIDHLRNGRGTTAVGAWSPRARAGFPIAAPVSWGQVENGIRAIRSPSCSHATRCLQCATRHAHLDLHRRGLASDFCARHGPIAGVALASDRS
jgi:hypothetical protein